jgi:hypothetical protein
MPLRRVIVGCHVLLIGALVTSLVPPATLLRVVMAALLALPLSLTLRGLVEGRRATLQRLSVLLVAYIGGLSVEVVARSGDALSFSIALLVAVLELGLALALIRRSAPSAQQAPE